MVRARSFVTMLAVAVLLFVLGGSFWLPEEVAMIATVLAAVLGAGSVLLFCVWLTHRQAYRHT
jgi:hypothetical protein